MTPAPIELEGTWEEIAAHEPEFTGMRLRVTILPANTGDPRLRILQEIAARSRSMHPKPDVRDYLREGRAGTMFGESNSR